MRVRLTLLTIAATLIAAAPASAATLPHRTLVGPAEGVQASLAGKTLTVRFTGASAAWGKRHARQQAFVSCEATPEPGLLFRDTEGTTGLGADTGFGNGEDGGATPITAADLGIARLSPSGASVTTRIVAAEQADLCQVRLGTSSADVAWATLTPRGAIGLDERQRGLRMADVIHAAAPKGAYRPAADVVALGGGEVVAMDDPNGTPPAGKIGYWSKGRAVSLVSASATGRRLEIQDLGGGMLRTDALDALLEWSPAVAPAEPSALGEDEDEDRSDDDLEAGEGLFAHLDGDEVVFRFTGKAARVYRRLAGRRVVVSCLKAPGRPLLGERLSFGTPAVTHVRVPAHGGTIRGRAPEGRNDLCVVETGGGRDVAVGYLTRAGRGYVYDAITPLMVLFDDDTPWALAGPRATRYAGVATIIAAHPGVVGLTTPGAALKAGRIGVWTDADQQAALVFSAPEGHRYVVVDEGAGRVRTNLFGSLISTLQSLYDGDPDGF